MQRERDLEEVWTRRRAKTRDAELRWLLDELRERLMVANTATRIAAEAIGEIHNAWLDLGVLKETGKEEKSG
jgi:hypothetical protein